MCWRQSLSRQQMSLQSSSSSLRLCFQQSIFANIRTDPKISGSIVISQFDLNCMLDNHQDAIGRIANGLRELTCAKQISQALPKLNGLAARINGIEQLIIQLRDQSDQQLCELAAISSSFEKQLQKDRALKPKSDVQKLDHVFQHMEEVMLCQSKGIKELQLRQLKGIDHTFDGLKYELNQQRKTREEALRAIADSIQRHLPKLSCELHKEQAIRKRMDEQLICGLTDALTKLDKGCERESAQRREDQQRITDQLKSLTKGVAADLAKQREERVRIEGQLLCLMEQVITRLTSK